MVSTLQESNNFLGAKHQVSVLLATFNGAKYLNEFLESLAAQENVAINLWVSDDGSSDKTLEIVEDFRNRFANIYICRGPGRGPKHNFIYLTTIAQGEYFAFADQDDIWAPNKLITGLRRIETSSVPCLYVGSVETRSGVTGKKPFSFPLSLTRNRSQGCTMIFNNELISLIRLVKPENIVMHDWMTLLTAQIIGEVHYDEKPTMFYRIHSGNSIGHKSFYCKLKNYLSGFARSGSRSEITLQVSELKSKLLLSIADPAGVFIQNWLDASDSSIQSRMTFCLRHLGNYPRNLETFLTLGHFVRGSFSLSKSD